MKTRPVEVQVGCGSTVVVFMGSAWPTQRNVLHRGSSLSGLAKNQQVLCRFSIVRASETASEGKFSRSLRRAESRLRQQFGTSLDGLPVEVKERLQRRYQWQQWPFNHVCGSVVLVAVAESSLRADVYLARRCFPRDHLEHAWRLPRHGDEILLYATGSEALVMPGNNISYQQVAAVQLDGAQRMIRSEGCGMRAATILVEPALEAVDLVLIYEQSQRRAASKNRRQRTLL